MNGTPVGELVKRYHKAHPEARREHIARSLERNIDTVEALLNGREPNGSHHSKPGSP